MLLGIEKDLYAHDFVTFYVGELIFYQPNVTEILIFESTCTFTIPVSIICVNTRLKRRDPIARP